MTSDTPMTPLIYQNSTTEVAFESHETQDLVVKGLGRPTRRKILSYLDLLATLISIGCFTAAAVCISHQLPYAASLGLNTQLVVLGVLLAVETLCLQRVLPFALLLFEAQYGKFTLQNIEGLLRTSPTASRLGWIWRIFLLTFKLLPLTLGVGYKRFTGGVAYSSISTSNIAFGPAAPPGFQRNTARSLREFSTNTGMINAVLANATVPFMTMSSDSEPFPKNLSSENPMVYGFSSILISNTSAAVIDAPLASRITELQKILQGEEAYHLTAKNIRGTVAQYNKSVEDESYWNQTYDIRNLDKLSLGNGYYFMVLQQGVASTDEARSWNGSWSLVGTYKNENNEIADDDSRVSQEVALKFVTSRAMRFDVKRHRCEGTWKITRSSVELQKGKCDKDPLPSIHQIYDNSQLAVSLHLKTSLADYLGWFATTRNQSHWLVPTHVAVMASAYHSLVAAREGFVAAQTFGKLWKAKNLGPHDWYNETYRSTEFLQMSKATFRDSPSLYAILGLQPAVTICAIVMIAFHFQVPISRNLGLISLLAGVERDTLDMLRGASYSGELVEPVGVRIYVSHFPDQDGVKIGDVQYRLGEAGSHGTIKRGFIYS